MKSIALIHTVKTVANSFDQTLKDYVGEPVKVHNLWDDFLANNPNEIGEFTIENRCRLYNDIKTDKAVRNVVCIKSLSWKTTLWSLRSTSNM